MKIPIGRQTACVYVHAVTFVKHNTKYQYLSTIVNDGTQNKTTFCLYIFFTEIGTNNRRNKYNFFFISFSFPSLATTTTTLTSLNCHIKHIDDNDYRVYEC